MLFVLQVLVIYIKKAQKSYPFAYLRSKLVKRRDFYSWNENIIPKMLMFSTSDDFIYIVFKHYSYFILKKEDNETLFKEIKILLKVKRKKFCRYYEM